MPRTIRPDFGLTFSPILFASKEGSDIGSLSIFSQAEATGGPSPGTVFMGLLLCEDLLDDTKWPSTSPSRLSCLQKRDICIKTESSREITSNNNKLHSPQALTVSPFTNLWWFLTSFIIKGKEKSRLLYLGRSGLQNETRTKKQNQGWWLMLGFLELST